MLIDTHCHLEMVAEDLSSVKEVVAEAQRADVLRMITVGTTVSTSSQAIQFAKLFEGTVWATVGLHPCDGHAGWRDDLAQLRLLIEGDTKHYVVAVGETGLDFYHPGEHRQYQESLFHAQIELAIEKKLPLVIHTRNSFDATMTILESYRAENILGVVHCFSEGIDDAWRVFDLGFLIGIGGPVTYPKNGSLRSVVGAAGLDHLLLETDAPFLPPQAIRGKKNSPREIATIARFISELLKVDFVDVAQKTTSNAESLFCLPKA
ncbi:MAG: TatD family hydrolase [Candidatus Babeliaceae bacterium]|nr:TatD family hydrolase [Candidatus Babeliaceae bacterium]